MNKVVQVVLPYPPRANQYWRLFTPPKGGPPRMIVSAKGRLYKKLVHEMLNALNLERITGPVRVRLDVFRPRAAGDLDGHPKVLLDALQPDDEGNGGILVNDNQLFAMHAEHWDHDKKRPRAQVTLEEDNQPRDPPAEWSVLPAHHKMLDEAQQQLEALADKETERRKQRAAKTPAPPSQGKLGIQPTPAFTNHRRGAR